ncbi:MAG TPA: universal stress protein [Nocardioides sp.]|uniref:universal stress protein n=1 Tax=Nocardioides sp. TaxID=35761 RepID=UPI002C1C4B12|nr:universal stress protein [Nocardioides sp.]HTW17226.1 universal stress protein [Nocardioides sp.]
METFTSISAVPAGTVVVGVDGSEGAARAVRWAATEADLTRRPLVLVHAWTLQGGTWLDQAGIDHREVAKAIKADAEQLVRTVRDEVLAVRPHLTVHELVVQADAREAFEELSRTASMVVVGSRGRGPVRSLLLGSVSVAVSRQSHCPVVVVRPGIEQATGGILVGVDGTPASQPALELAFREASLRELPLTVVHCFWDAQVATLPAHQVPDDAMAAYADLELMVAASMSGLREKYPDVQVERVLWRGLVDEALVAASGGRDLTVVGLRRTNGLRSLIRVPVAPAVVERADGAVAVVPHEAETDA